VFGNSTTKATKGQTFYMNSASRKNILWQLFTTFFKIGLFTFGGGYAMIALLEREFVTKKKWLSYDEFLDVVAIAESTPGPVAINAATYIGYKLVGFKGALTATLAVSMPSFVIIFVISLFFDQFMKLKYVAYAFEGIKACVIYLIFSAGLKLFKALEKNAFNLIIVGAVVVIFSLFTIFSVKFSSVFFILICGGIGVLFYLIKRFKQPNEATGGAK